MWRDLTPDPSVEVGPGVYLLELGAPRAVLDRFVANHSVMYSIAAGILERTDKRIRVEGGGVQWGTVPGTNIQRRTLVFRFRVLRDDELPIEVIEAGLSPKAFWAIGTLVGILAVLLSINVGLLTIERIAKHSPEAAEDITGGFADLAAATKWLVVGGLAAGALFFANRFGILEVKK